MRTRHIRLDVDINMNLKKRNNDTLEDLVKSYRGLKIPGTAYIGLYPTNFNVARTHMEIGGLWPMEAAGAYFEHPNKRPASYKTRRTTATPPGSGS